MPPITDPSAIRTLLELDRSWSVYALGDLSPSFFAHCRWFRAPDDRPALALLYEGYTPPVLFALGEASGLRAVLAEVGDVPQLYLHVRPEVVPLLEGRYRIVNRKEMWRMVLDQAAFRPAGEEGIVRLGPPDLESLRRLFADGDAAGEAPDFFAPEMLDDGVYFGVCGADELLAAAGTHQLVPAEGVAAVGNE
jgi:hypothetical protein